MSNNPRVVLIIAALLSLALSGCGRDPNAEALRQKCLQGGNPESMCNCVADAMEENLPPDMLAAIAQGDNAASFKFMMEHPDEFNEATQKNIVAMAACGALR